MLGPFTIDLPAFLKNETVQCHFKPSLKPLSSTHRKIEAFTHICITATFSKVVHTGQSKTNDRNSKKMC